MVIIWSAIIDLILNKEALAQILKSNILYMIAKMRLLKFDVLSFMIYQRKS